MLNRNLSEKKNVVLAIVFVLAAMATAAIAMPWSSGFALFAPIGAAPPSDSDTPFVVLYDQYNNPGTNGFTSQDFEAANDAFDTHIADDFVVPAGETWTIQGVDVDGVYFGGPGPAASFNVNFYNNSGTLPGTLNAGRAAQAFTGTAGDAVITISPAVVLTPGTYWVSVQARQDFTPAGQWGWIERTVQSNSPAAFQNPGGGFMTCPTWGVRSVCLAAGGPDQVFRLNGTLGGGATPTPTPTPPGATPTPTPGAPPPNDQCAGVVTIPPAGPFPHLTSAVDVTNATTVGDPPLPSCQTSVSRSIWYTFTPAVTGSYTISSCQTAAPASTLPDIVLAIYTSAAGCAGPFTQLAGVAGCDDDSCTTLTLQAVISNTALTAGTQYYILAHKFGTGAPTAGAASIQFQVSLAGVPTPTPTPTPPAATPTPTPPGATPTPTPGAPPPNDQCAGVVTIPPAGPFPHLTSAVDVTNATTVGDPPLPTCQTSVSRSIWYTFTPAVTGSYTISSCQTEAPASTLPDIVLAIYTAASCAGPFTQLPGVAGCDDDSCTTLALQAIISNTTLTAGTQYYILAHKFGSGAPVAPADDIQFRVSLAGGPTPTPTPTQTPGITPTPLVTPSPGGCNFNNGGLNPQPLTESLVPAPAGFFWSEVQHDTGNTTQANTNAGYNSTQGGGFRLADNFTIGAPCTLNSAIFYGYQTGAPATPSPFTAYTLQIWNGRPGDAGAVVVFGDTTTNRLASSVDSTFFRIFNTVVPPPGTPQTTTRKIWRNTVTIGAVLPAGTYWVDWADTTTGGANHFTPGKTIAGSRGAVGDNARQFATGVWVDVTDVGFPAGGTPVPQDFPFEIIGTGGGATPTPPAATPTPSPSPTCAPAANVIVDGTFEAGSPWTAWTTQTSTNFGTPMCDVACGTGGGTAGGFGGSVNWAWFGGIASAETATAGQSVVIASGGSASLTFQLWIGAVSAPFTDVLNVRVDGTIVASFPEPAVAEPGYTLRTVDVGAFANGASHAILFEYIGPGGGVGNFSVDNVSLVAGGVCASPSPGITPTPPVPSPSPTCAPTGTLRVVPNEYTSTQASTSGLNTLIRDTGNPRTAQLLINANQLTGLVGQSINSLTARLWSGAVAPYPATAATWTDYTISMGQGVAFGSQTTTFATNFVGAPTVVRSGPLTIPAGAFTIAGTPRPFGSEITLTTPFVYTGGNLLIEVRHTGSNIVNTATDFLEAAALTDPNYNVNFWSATATGNTATTGAANTFTVVRLNTAGGACGTPTPGITPTPPAATPTPSPTCAPATTFTNPAAITIPDSGPGTPYPSNIAVAGLTGTITKVTVGLNSLTHTFPADIDILLVGPGAQNAIIMSDVGGGGPGVTNVTFTLDDAAAAPIPATNFPSGTYRPTNSGTGDTWPAPAPAPAGGSPLSIFNGTAPNGTWALYLVDDAGADVGTLAGGWTLNISTTTGSCATPTPGITPTPPSGTPTPTPCPAVAPVWALWTTPASGAGTARLVTFSATAPQTFTIIGDTGINTTSNFPNGLDFDGGGNLFATGGTNTNFWFSVNQTTGLATLIGGSGLAGGQTVVDLAYDRFNNRMLAVGSGTNPVLLQINTATGAATALGTITGTTETVAVSLAARASDGAIFLHGVATDRWYNVNPTTFVATPLAVLPFDTNFGQGGTFDPNNGTLYHAAFNSTAFQGELHTINPATGASAFVGNMGDLTNPQPNQISDIAINLVGCVTPTPTVTPPTATPTPTPTPPVTPTPATTSVQFAAATFPGDESQIEPVTITRTGITTAATSGNFSATSGTAVGGAACTSGVDFLTIASQPFLFSAGETTKTFFITLCPDTLIEPMETINLALSGLVGGTLGTPGTAVMNLNDTANQWRNPTEISFNLGAPAAPYPSTITVAGGPLQIGTLRVTLYDVTHELPDNMDFLLVGPTGVEFILMADAGGPVNLTTPATLTFTDVAGVVVPNNGPLVTGNFEPTNWETPVSDFAPPAPIGPYNEPGSAVGGTGTETLVGNFGFTNSNGDWKLFARDDNSTTVPEVLVGLVAGGWGLEFLQPTAAGVSLGGRVTTASGAGIRNARLVITGNALSEPRVVTTGSFGYYSFEGLMAGETYVVTVNSTRYTFAVPSQVITLVDNLTDVDFTATGE